MSGLAETFAGIVTDGSLLLAMAVAALVGLVSFASPCCLPLVPGYVGYIAGLAGSDATVDNTTAQSTVDAGRAGGATTTAQNRLSVTAAAGGPEARLSRRRLLVGSLLFVAGFTVVFVAFGALFGGLGRLLLQWEPVLTRVAGVVTVVMGLAFLGWVPWLQREKRLHHLPSGGLAGAPVLGFVFGLGWTPCMGPTLGAVNSLAYNEASAVRGAILGLAYCLGLGIPFVAMALGARRAVRMSAWARRHARTVMRFGGGLLLLLGFLLLTGFWEDLMFWLRAWLAQTGLGSSFL
ncbi:cytochrome c biogenesis CcdA family protein [Candidatus Blastococcus massiliensis]|uniref:cytochrome c biogenesis CcdA family protein n=1 Tax=Candidatus Blastococcus massiliensis TaxID=1470358 RepID=UPI0004B7B353|nr:cytochrome c biogenesis protein CcdA [Candidatus Blastococcus massiliensis]